MSTISEKDLIEFFRQLEDKPLEPNNPFYEPYLSTGESDPIEELTRNIKHARDLARADEKLQNVLKNQDFAVALNYLQALQPTNAVEQRRRKLLIELLGVVTTDNFVEQRQAWRRYVAYLAEYAVIGYEMLEKEQDERTWWQRLLFWRKVGSYAEEKEMMAELYAWTKIVEARQKGELPVWEGIRIVRDRSEER